MTTSKKNICLHRYFALPTHNSDTTFLKQTIQENHNPSKNSSLTGSDQSETFVSKSENFLLFMLDFYFTL